MQRTLFILTLVLSFFLSGLQSGPAQEAKPVVYVSAQDSAEMWATGKKPKGRGTQADPFYGDFDAILSKIPPNTSIQLIAAPGQFASRFYTQIGRAHV